MAHQSSALTEIGLAKAIKFFFTTLALIPFKLLIFPQLRSLYLRCLGSTVESGTIIHSINFFNAYRKGFSAIKIGKRCFIGEHCLWDLADDIVVEDEVTIAEQVTILTHTNVGYSDHPLQKYFPAFNAPVTIKHGAFIGTNATIMPGVTIGQGAFVGACSLVIGDVPPWHVVGGVPAKTIRILNTNI